jgi:large subunit ribosomal protein L13
VIAALEIAGVKTYMARKETVEREWVLLDATDVPLGRLAGKAAVILMGKHKPGYTPHVDTGDFVVVVNASKVKLTGRKREQKVYRYHTGYFGHLREKPVADVLERRPERVVEMAVRRMMPKTKLGRSMFKKMKVYKGPEHPHAAQRPRAWREPGSDAGGDS